MPLILLTGCEHEFIYCSAVFAVRADPVGWLSYFAPVYLLILAFLRFSIY